MKETAIKKINSMGKVAGIITLIAKVLVGVAFAACLIATIIFTVIPTNFIKISTRGVLKAEIDMSEVNYHFSDAERDAINKSIDDGMVDGSIKVNGQNFGKAEISVAKDSIFVNASGEYNTFTLKKLIPVMLIAALNIACAFVTLMFVGFLCKAFKECQSPFEDNVTKAMRNLAFALIPWAVMSSISNSISASFIMNQGYSFNMNVDLNVVVTILIIFALTYVFKYGAMLQKESDETL